MMKKKTYRTKCKSTNTLSTELAWRRLCFPVDTCLWDDRQAWRVGRNEAQEERVHVHLKWRYSSHHTEVIHHEETVTRQPIHASAGEPACSQKVPVNVEVWEAARERIKLVLRLEATQVPKGYLFFTEGECKHRVNQKKKHLSQTDLIKSCLPCQKCAHRRRNDWFGALLPLQVLQHWTVKNTKRK